MDFVFELEFIRGFPKVGPGLPCGVRHSLTPDRAPANVESGESQPRQKCHGELWECGVNVHGSCKDSESRHRRHALCQSIVMIRVLRTKMSM